MQHRVVGIDGLRSTIGRELGPSEPIRIDQAMVEAFADVTHDHQWIHVDPERARTEGPFGGTIAHGYLVLSLVPPLLFGRLLQVEGVTSILNYGIDKLRFVDVCRVGADLTLRATLQSLDAKGIGQLGRYGLVFEASGSSRPCCVAEILLLFTA
jgi:acyl dehydratase